MEIESSDIAPAEDKEKDLFSTDAKSVKLKRLYISDNTTCDQPY
jgi:hypothetical protein